MRVGLVSADFWPNVGGVAAHVAELGRALARLGHETHVVTRPLGVEREPESRFDGMLVHRVELPRLKPLADRRLRGWLQQLLRQRPLDLLHVHGMRPLPATRGLSLPIVFTNHTSGFLQRLQRGRLARCRAAGLLAQADLILAPSEELAEATLSLGLDRPVRYIPNGVDPARFTGTGANARQRLGIQPEETVVLLARRLVAKNGVCVFAEAVARFLRPGVRVLLAGDGPERPQVEAILRRDGAHAAALFLGNVSNAEMPAIYRAADISVLPSFLEATSITGLESMATGLPLVGTRVGGIPALIEHERTGLLVDPGNPRQLAAAIERLIAEPRLRAEWGAAARRRVEQEFSWDVIARRTADCYDRVLRVVRSRRIDNRRHGAAPTDPPSDPFVARRAAGAPREAA